MGSIDGPNCRHGVNAFDPRGCAACTAEYERMKPKTVTKANGHVPLSTTFIKDKFKPTESD
jgi:hypothetical protein